MVVTNALLLHLGKGRRKGKGRDQDVTQSLRPGKLESIFQVIKVGGMTFTDMGMQNGQSVPKASSSLSPVIERKD